MLSGDELKAFLLRKDQEQNKVVVTHSHHIFKYSIGSRGHSNQTMKRNEKHTNWKGRCKIHIGVTKYIDFVSCKLKESHVV